MDNSVDNSVEKTSPPRAALTPSVAKVPKPYLITITIVCLAGLAFGSAYAATQHIPAGVAVALGAAGLLQLCAYASLAFPALLRLWTPARLLLFAPWPWLIYSIPCGVFRPHALVALLALAAVAAFWFHFLPRGRLTDLGFVALMAAPVLLNWFAAIYPPPEPKLPAALLGHLFWIQTGLATMLNVRGVDPDFGFWPAKRHWRAGLFWYLAALPPLGIAERLGPEGLRLRELARGEAERKLTPLEEPPRFEDAIELEYPVDLLEPLAFLLARLLNGLCTRLATRALATDELRLRLQLEGRAAHERTLRLPVPSLDSKAFLKLLQLDLAAHPPEAPVVHVWMGMNPVKPRFAQSGLFIPAAPEPVKL